MEPDAHRFKGIFFSSVLTEKTAVKQTVPRNCSLTLHELAFLPCLCVQLIWCMPYPMSAALLWGFHNKWFYFLQICFLNYFWCQNEIRKHKLRQAFPTAKISYLSFHSHGDVFLEVIHLPEPSKVHLAESHINVGHRINIILYLKLKIHAPMRK